MGLSDEELAYYDALAQNQSALDVMGQKELAVVATELVKHVRRNATIDWTVKQTARAKMRVLVKRFLRKYGIRPICRTPRRRPCWSRPGRSRRSGRPHDLKQN